MAAFVVLGAAGSTRAAQPSPGGSAPARAPLDLNRATAEELETLPGIGAAKAAAILAAREAQGGFSSPEQLESVRGIGPALMAKLRPLVVVGGPSAPAKRAPAPASAKPVPSASASPAPAAAPSPAAVR